MARHEVPIYKRGEGWLRTERRTTTTIKEQKKMQSTGTKSEVEPSNDGRKALAQVIAILAPYRDDVTLGGLYEKARGAAGGDDDGQEIEKALEVLTEAPAALAKAEGLKPDERRQLEEGIEKATAPMQRVFLKKHSPAYAVAGMGEREQYIRQTEASSIPIR